MKKIAFDNEKYLKMQSEHIMERIKTFGGKLYLEFGGKLFDDYHASRVLPGFMPDSKLRMLLKIKDRVEIVIAVGSEAIEKNKVRGDLGITYESEVLRLIDEFRNIGLYVGSIVLTMYQGQPKSKAFTDRLMGMGIKVYHHYPIEGYPADISRIVSDEGYGKNDYIETQRELVVVTAPGPGSGKMATCLSQLYHEYKRGIKAGYAKFETFPIWNIPLKHPVNIAYEAATADLDDVNMIDPFHLEAYGETTVNYNRDVEIYPVLAAMMKKIMGECPYKSPTDMGVNMAGNCIIDDEAAREASNQEIIRRYYAALRDKKMGENPNNIDNIILKLDLLMKQAGLSTDDRAVAKTARYLANETKRPAAAIELPNGRIVTGKTTDLMGCCSAAIINALKALGNIDDDVKLISRSMIEPIQRLKTEAFGSKNPRLHSDEILIALSVCAVSDPLAEKALLQVPLLKECEAHCSVILSSVDVETMRKLGIRTTCEPEYEVDRLYHE